MLNCFLGMKLKKNFYAKVFLNFYVQLMSLLLYKFK